MNYLTQAIFKLRPGSQFKYDNFDYSTIEWIVLEGNPPTQAEIDATIEQIKIDEAQAEATKAAQKQALLNRLGITEDEAKLLLGGN